MVERALTSDVTVIRGRERSRLLRIATGASIIAGVAFLTKFTMIFARGHAVGVEWPAFLLFAVGMVALFVATGAWAAHTVPSRRLVIRIVAILGSLVVLALAITAVEQTLLMLYPEALPAAELALLGIGIPALAFGLLQLLRFRS